MFALFENPRLRGGIHAEEHKTETSALPIATDFPLPKKLYIRCNSTSASRPSRWSWSAKRC
ncbi:hypothetical protein [Methylomonas koyamae]|uniref:hypothetical protein n=1 Tax=Methylomonas koyamae TaxID=702114 RepID=UPI00278BEA3D|nr:hypothetical protein [Methylomonas koyamae]